MCILHIKYTCYFGAYSLNGEVKAVLKYKNPLGLQVGEEKTIVQVMFVLLRPCLITDLL